MLRILTFMSCVLASIAATATPNHRTLGLCSELKATVDLNDPVAVLSEKLSHRLNSIHVNIGQDKVVRVVSNNMNEFPFAVVDALKEQPFSQHKADSISFTHRGNRYYIKVTSTMGSWRVFNSQDKVVTGTFIGDYPIEKVFPSLQRDFTGLVVFQFIDGNGKKLGGGRRRIDRNGTRTTGGITIRDESLRGKGIGVEIYKACYDVLPVGGLITVRSTNIETNRVLNPIRQRIKNSTTYLELLERDSGAANLHLEKSWTARALELSKLGDKRHNPLWIGLLERSGWKIERVYESEEDERQIMIDARKVSD